MIQINFINGNISITFSTEFCFASKHFFIIGKIWANFRRKYFRLGIRQTAGMRSSLSSADRLKQPDMQLSARRIAIMAVIY